MQNMAAVCSICLFLVPFVAVVADTNPLSKVVDLLGELEAKVTKEGEAEAKAYKEFFEWCDGVSKNGEHSIATGASQKEKLEARIDDLAAEVSVAESKVADLAKAITQADTQHRNASTIRRKESADFATSERELVDTIDTIDRAIDLLQKEMAKNPVSFAQASATSSFTKTVEALSQVLNAAAFPASDQKKLLVLAQSHDGDGEDDDGFTQPVAPTYKTHSGGILDVLEDLKEKAEGQLSDLRKAETNARHNYEMLAQSLKDQIDSDTKDLNEQKIKKAAAEEGKATAVGELQVTEKDLATVRSALETAKSSCITTAADHEATVGSRKEELQAIAEARRVLQETMKGAVEQSYAFVQVVSATSSSMRTTADLARLEVITIIKRLSKEHHSQVLAQLASRIAAVVQFGASTGEDPFAKVKDMIQSMIAKLEKEASAETTEKQYCDDTTANTEAKKSDLEDDIAKMTSKMDQAAARAADLRAQVKELQAQLAALAEEQLAMDKFRAEAHENFLQAKADLELGLAGVRKALSVLRDYYGRGEAALLQDAGGLQAYMKQPAVPEKHVKASGAGSSILSMLEVVESDFAKNLAKEESEEEDSQSEYDSMTQQNKITRAAEEQDVKYKSAEAQSLDKTVSELSSDRETANAEHAALMEFYEKLQSRCVPKPETYQERAQRRAAEVVGLKEALSILEQETALVQRPKHSFRGSVLAAK